MQIKKKTLFTVREMVFTAICAAIICVLAPISVPINPAVPISLGTLAIYFTSAILGGKRGTLAVIVYILIGLAGLPVFTGMSAGFAKLFGPTGGYIIGYIPLAMLTGVFSDMSFRKNAKLHWMMPVGMVLGTAVMYTFGTVWFMILSGYSLAAALDICVLPFLAFDSVKIVLSTLLAVPLKEKLGKIMSGKAE